MLEAITTAPYGPLRRSARLAADWPAGRRVNYILKGTLDERIAPARPPLRDAVGRKNIAMACPTGVKANTN